MSLLELLFGEGEGVPETPERPAALELHPQPLSIYAPVTGTTMPMADIPDPIFASGAMGQAVGIKPRDGVVYAPVSGTVTLITHTLHAIGLESDDGLQILIHLGVDTVKLRGEGFHGFVQQGQRVEAGEPLVVMDLDRIAEAGYSDVVITAVSNTDDFASVVVAGSGQVSAGDQVLSAHR
ncbi:MAG: PTS glucose transporter subunit IIA [Olegusella sp.]|nr:PTS glucose transporter subunit IIA [Olegusella sp.]